MIQFLQDFRGKLTKEQFYVFGSVETFDDATERALVEEGRAQYVTEEVPQTAEVKRRGRKAKAG